MRVSSRAIIIENGKILTMFRRVLRNGVIKEYNAIPGGGQENGETLEQNVTRELKEEMNIDIEILGILEKPTIAKDKNTTLLAQLKTELQILAAKSLKNNPAKTTTNQCGFRSTIQKA